MEELDRHYKKVIESLKLLSLSYEKQKTLFPDFVDVPFEILDTFENAFLLLPSLIENTLFSYNSIAYLLRLHNIIIITSQIPKFKDLNEHQFQYSLEWEKIREMSKDALKQIGEPLSTPNTEYI